MWNKNWKLLRNIIRYDAICRWFRINYPEQSAEIAGTQWLLDRIDLAYDVIDREAMAILPFKAFPNKSFSRQPNDVKRAYGRMMRIFLPEVLAYQRMSRKVEKFAKRQGWPGLYSFEGNTHRERFATCIAEQMGDTQARVLQAFDCYVAK